MKRDDVEDEYSVAVLNVSIRELRDRFGALEAAFFTLEGEIAKLEKQLNAARSVSAEGKDRGSRDVPEGNDGTKAANTLPPETVTGMRNPPVADSFGMILERKITDPTPTITRIEVKDMAGPGEGESRGIQAPGSSTSPGAASHTAGVSPAKAAGEVKTQPDGEATSEPLMPRLESTSPAAVPLSESGGTADAPPLEGGGSNSMRVQVPPLAQRKRGRKCGDCGGTGVIVLDPLNDNGTKPCAKCEKREAKKAKAKKPTMRDTLSALREAAGGAFDGVDPMKLNHDMRHEEGEHGDCAWCMEERKKAAAAPGAVAVVEETAGSGGAGTGERFPPEAPTPCTPAASPLSEQEGANW